MGTRLLRLRKLPRDTEGFTLIELMVVVAIIAILGMMLAPRLTRFLSKERNNFAILTGTIVTAFDDAFFHNRTNFLIVHLYEPYSEETEMGDEIFKHANGLTVAYIKDGKFVESKNRALKTREFDNDFKIEEVLLANGEKITNGHVSIPFYPQGYSDNIILHILVSDEDRVSVRINKYIKEPEVIKEYVTFEDL